MGNGFAQPGGQPNGRDGGAVVIRRLHRMVRHGYVPLLGYDVASGQDRDIRLHRKGAVAVLHPDGAVRFEPAARANGTGPHNRLTTVAGHDDAGFDALFPPDTPNKRNLVRRLYEMGIGS